VKLTEQETGNVFSDKLNFIYIEMPKFNKTESELETHFDKWLFAIKNLYRLDAIPGSLREQIFERFFEIAEIARMDPEERTRYESSLKYYRDMKNVIDTAKGEGWETGHAQGEAKGIVKGRQEELREDILEALEIRFHAVSCSIKKQIEGISDAAELRRLFRLAIQSPTIEDFTTQMPNTEKS